MSKLKTNTDVQGCTVKEAADKLTDRKLQEASPRRLNLTNQETNEILFG